MKTQKQLLKLYNNAKGEKNYYSFDNFRDDAKSYIKDIKNRNTVCSMHVSASGMTRKFNYTKYNMLLNICYNSRFSWEQVKVGGCGMDMHWYLQFTACEDLCTKKENEKYNFNSLSSSGYIL